MAGADTTMTSGWTTLADNSKGAEHGLKSQAEIDDYNQKYLAEQQRVKTERDATINILGGSPGRSATILAGPTKGIL